MNKQNSPLHAAIIGYWRSGASIEEIIALTGLFYLAVVRIIENHKN